VCKVSADKRTTPADKSCPRNVCRHTHHNHPMEQYWLLCLHALLCTIVLLPSSVCFLNASFCVLPTLVGQLLHKY
jgi:hypothetical protein